MKEQAFQKRVARLQELEQRNQALEAQAASNQMAADVLTNMISQSVAVQALDGSITVPSASKRRPSGQ